MSDYSIAKREPLKGERVQKLRQNLALFVPTVKLGEGWAKL